MPDQSDATRVFCGVGKASIDELHQDISLVIIKGIHTLLNVRGLESSQHVQDNVKVTFLGVIEQHTYDTSN